MNRPQSEEELAALRRSVARGRPLGEASWVRRMAEQWNPQTTLRSPRPAEEGAEQRFLTPLFHDPDSDRHARMVEWIREQLNLTTLQYQRLDDLVAAIGIPREKLCTYCWTGACETCPGSKAARRPVAADPV